MSINIGKTREVCWDFYLVDKKENIDLKLHKPVRKNIVMTLDEKWEGNCCGYFSLLKVGEIYKLYYRAVHCYEGQFVEGDQFHNGNYEKRESFCVACSLDGKTFFRPSIDKYEILGSKKNNVVYRYLDQPLLDNFSVFYDENPNCPADEKFKALVPYDKGHMEFVKPSEIGIDESRNPYGYLHYLVSADGIQWKYGAMLPIHGTFDTFNVLLWDKKSGQYFLYTRDFHDGNTNEPEAGFEEDFSRNSREEKLLRDVRVSTSTDMKNWIEHGVIDFGEDAEDYELYTNGITKYYRSENMFWGMPTRYINRAEDDQNFKYLKLPQIDRMKCLEEEIRTGYCFTDSILITSRDGFHFNRTDEAFRTPGLENGSNWIYGDCYNAYGVVQTESDISGEPDEMSFYTTEGYRTRPVDVVRYTVRLDGFFSFHGNYAGGELLTKPIIFDGKRLSINFETSALGHIRIKLCDADGNEIEGYDSREIFGNSVDRNVDFEKPLAALSGKEVRMKIELKDGDLYSFMFNE